MVNEHAGLLWWGWDSGGEGKGRVLGPYQLQHPGRLQRHVLWHCHQEHAGEISFSWYTPKHQDKVLLPQLFQTRLEQRRFCLDMILWDPQHRVESWQRWQIIWALGVLTWKQSIHTQDFPLKYFRGHGKLLSRLQLTFFSTFLISALSDDKMAPAWVFGLPQHILQPWQHSQISLIFILNLNSLWLFLSDQSWGSCWGRLFRADEECWVVFESHFNLLIAGEGVSGFS